MDRKLTLFKERLKLLNTVFHFFVSFIQGRLDSRVCMYVQTRKEYLSWRLQNGDRLRGGLHCEVSALLHFMKYCYADLWYLLGTLSFFFIQYNSTFKGLTKSVMFHLTEHLLTHSHDQCAVMKDTSFLGKTSKKGEEGSCPVCERTAGIHGALPGMDNKPMESRWVSRLCMPHMLTFFLL